GPTEPDNLVLLCSDHHDLIHVFGWRVELARDGTVHWFKPNNQPYEPGRSPPPRRSGSIDSFEFA
ncbi:MAG: HNH endonuclease signature motif containing protein, partial [Actinomycetota bacterium]